MTRAYWREMIFPDSPVPLSHDGYLKVFVISFGKRAMAGEPPRMNKFGRSVSTTSGLKDETRWWNRAAT